MAGRIRHRRDCLSNLQALDLDPKMKKIYGTFGGNDLLIVNEFHKAKGFRKIHLEIAILGSSLEILHCVFFPDPRFDLPIFGVDIVKTLDAISAAIVDLSPVSDSLPPSFERKLRHLDFPKFKNVRKLPDWGNIFSDYVQFIKPDDNKEDYLFLDLVDRYLDILISNSSTQEPEIASSPLSIDRYAKQQFYCLQQKRNDKTRNVLSRTFSPEWAEEYIEMVLFNCPKGYLTKKI